MFSDLADCITLKQWKLCCMGWPKSPSKKDLLSSCWGMQSLYGLQLSVHSGIIWVALPKITPLPWWFKGMIVLPHVGPAPSFFLMLLIIVLLSSPVAYWTPFDLGWGGGGVHLPVSYLFAFLYSSWASRGKGTGVIFHFLLKCFKKLRHHFADKGPYSQDYDPSSSHVRMCELDHKEG